MIKRTCCERTSKGLTGIGPSFAPKRFVVSQWAMRFPGTPTAYTALYQVTSADILARATEWATTSESAANEIFNVTNGDYFRWIHLWPALARYFDMPCGDPLPLRLTEQMADKELIWNRITERHGLEPIPYSQIAYFSRPRC